MKIVIPLLLVSCGEISGTGNPKDSGIELDSSSLIDDCTESKNDTPATATGLTSDGATVHAGLQLCEDEVDFYTIDVPPGVRISIRLDIDGAGHNGVDGTDLDLWEVAGPSHSVQPALDLEDNDIDEHNIIWFSASTQPHEFLSWHNPSQSTVTRLIMLSGFESGSGTYTLSIDSDLWEISPHCTEDCDDLAMLPQAMELAEGYILNHISHYSFGNRTVTYPLLHAAGAIAESFPGTQPLGILDISQFDGDTPGQMEGSLRHSEGEHRSGQDVDVAYYQTEADNRRRAICDNDGALCTETPHALDVERTAAFLDVLVANAAIDTVRVDPLALPLLSEAAPDVTPVLVAAPGHIDRIHIAFAQ